MSSTKLVSRAVSLASAFNRGFPGAQNGSKDPALSNADWVRQFILSPPFAWRWNRSLVAPINLNPGVTDYTVALPQFGWIEKAVLQYTQNGTPMSQELKVYMTLGQGSGVGMPGGISALLEDGHGNITFRLNPAPDQPYELLIMTQNAAPIFGSLNDTWAPIPDYLSYLYDQGMIAKACEHKNDSRFAFEMQTFLRMVIAANDGLTETQVNIYLADRLNTAREQQGIAGSTPGFRLGLQQ